MKYATPPKDLIINSITQVLKENSEYKDLIISVLENLEDLDTQDIYYSIDGVNQQGAGGGYGNYIYYAQIITWLKDRSLQKEISIYFRNWAGEVYSSDKDFSYYLVEYDLVNEKDFNDDIYFDSTLFNLTYLVCKSSSFFRDYDAGDFISSVYKIYKYMDNDKDIDLDGHEATFISWFVLEGVCYMFDK